MCPFVVRDSLRGFAARSGHRLSSMYEVLRPRLGFWIRLRPPPRTRPRKGVWSAVRSLNRPAERPNRGPVGVIPSGNAENSASVVPEIEGIENTLEGFSDNFEGIAEKIEGIPNTLEGFSDNFEGIAKKIEGIPNTLEGFSDNFEGIAKKIEDIPNTLEGILDNLEGIAKRIEGIGNTLEVISNTGEGIARKTEGMGAAFEGSSAPTEGGAGNAGRRWRIGCMTKNPMSSRRSSAWISSTSSDRIPASTSSGLRVRHLGFLAALRFVMPRVRLRKRLIPDPPAAWEAKSDTSRKPVRLPEGGTSFPPRSLSPTTFPPPAYRRSVYSLSSMRTAPLATLLVPCLDR